MQGIDETATWCDAATLARRGMPTLPEEVRPFNHPIVVGFPVTAPCQSRMQCV
ncbi:hypothetical protein PIN31009_04639 [Pandoraea iniqua]|nr:hypothetical protein PIN31009_04639 [Pandoraea iniqua]